MAVAVAVEGLEEAPVEQVAVDAAALLTAALPDEPDADLSLVLCDDAHVRELNRTWRGIDSATDVLSFPQDDPVVLGDLVISLVSYLAG